MLFNSWEFAAFFVVVLALYYALAFRWQNLMLLAASYMFYGMWDWRFLALLWTSTIVDFLVARALDRRKAKRERQVLLGISLATNLGILGFFKYCNFFLDSTADLLESLGFHANVPVLQIVLPVGISFYTFQTLAYTVDVYRGQQKHTDNWISFALYVAYFPQLMAGPIERARRLLPQLESRRTVTNDHISRGLQLILWGYLKKVAIGDSLARYVEAAFSAPGEVDQISLWIAMYAFTIQVYCDFSGYSDIARGTSRLLGINLMENFRQPLLSPNITEFWRRWHISLSTWLRDYVYIPLGGNRVSSARQYGNLFLTFALSGLWHGANWTFVVWGALHGLFMCFHKFRMGGRPVPTDSDPHSLADWIRYIPSVFLTFHCFAIPLVLFRCSTIDVAGTYYWGMLFSQVEMSTFNYERSFAGMHTTLYVYALAVLCMDVGFRRSGDEVPCTTRMAWWTRGLVYAGALLMLAFVRDAHVDRFFYFQF